VLTKSIIENVLIIAGEGFWVLSAFAQVKRLVRTKNRKGLSAPNQTLNAAGNIAWITYFSSRHLYVPVASNLALFLLTVTALFYTLGNKNQFKRGLLAIAVVGPLTSYLLLQYPSISGWVGAAYNFIASLPWVFHVVRTKKTSGISERSLMFTYGALTCVFIYSILIVSIPLVVNISAAFITTSIIARYYYRYRHESRKYRKPKHEVSTI
jgi:uncharacterized protein with PQ loop repeat